VLTTSVKTEAMATMEWAIGYIQTEEPYPINMVGLVFDAMDDNSLRAKTSSH